MASIGYEVDLVLQELSPICWVASCAMVKGFMTQTSVSVGDLIGHDHDPESSSIPNPSHNWSSTISLTGTWGFDPFAIPQLVPSGLMTGERLVAVLEQRGPAVLLHTCDGFPYGPRHAAPPRGSAHAVVITGVDTDQNGAWFNNPWGDRDKFCDLDILLVKINSDQVLGETLVFWPVTEQLRLEQFRQRKYLPR
jgi:Papain-like cysteine protease AvrRpt2